MGPRLNFVEFGGRAQAEKLFQQLCLGPSCLGSNRRLTLRRGPSPFPLPEFSAALSNPAVRSCHRQKLNSLASSDSSSNLRSTSQSSIVSARQLAQVIQGAPLLHPNNVGDPLLMCVRPISSKMGGPPTPRKWVSLPPPDPPFLPGPCMI